MRNLDIEIVLEIATQNSLVSDDFIIAISDPVVDQLILICFVKNQEITHVFCNNLYLEIIDNDPQIIDYLKSCNFEILRPKTDDLISFQDYLKFLKIFSINMTDIKEKYKFSFIINDICLKQT